MPVLQKRGGAATPAHTLPPSRNETIRDRLNRPPGRNEAVRPRDRAWSQTPQQRPPNRKTLSDRPAPLPVPQQAANRPEHTVERGEQNDEARPEDGSTRIDDEPFHHEADRAGARATTTREPILGARTARVVERARKKNMLADTYFQSNLSCRMGRLVCRWSHHLTQRQYRSPPVRPQSLQSSPGPHRKR